MVLDMYLLVTSTGFQGNGSTPKRVLKIRMAGPSASTDARQGTNVYLKQCCMTAIDTSIVQLGDMALSGKQVQLIDEKFDEFVVGVWKVNMVGGRGISVCSV